MKIKLLLRMASADNVENNWLGMECQRLDINANIGRPDGSHLINLNSRRCRTRAIPGAVPVVPPGLVLPH